MEFSVLLSVYKNEKPEYLQSALDSVLQQTLLPNELVIVEDGPLTPSLYKILEGVEVGTSIKIKRLAFKENRGLGLALKDGVLACSYVYIARMDTDDFALPQRFEKQIAYLEQHPEIAMVGSWIKEFREDPQQPDTITKLPVDTASIREYAKSRNPFRHMTVIYKKEAVLQSGSYRDFLLFEDYDLWVRMLQAGYELANLPECLVMVRADDDMFARRGGSGYILKELRFQWFLYDSGFISLFKLITNVGLRVAVRLLPNGLRVWIYKKLLRRSVS